jgi:hypothetical protein
VFLGFGSGQFNATGGGNVCVGTNAGQYQSGTGTVYIGNNTGIYAGAANSNVGVGNSALQGQSTGNPLIGAYNIGIGERAGADITSGFGNICIGHNAGTAGNNIQTGTYNVLLGYGANASGTGISDEIVIGRITGRGALSATINVASGKFNLSGYSGGSPLTTDGVGNVLNTSDRRMKTNIVYLGFDGNLDIIKRLKPVSYALNYESYKPKWVGFIAQDLEEVLPNCVDCKKYEYQFEADAKGAPLKDETGAVIYKLDADGNRIPRYKSVDTTEIFTRGILAIQEQQGIIETLGARLATAETVIEEQHAKITSLEAQLAALNDKMGSLLLQVATLTAAILVK